MFSGLKRIQTKRRRRSSGTPPPVPRQRMQPVRPERFPKIEAERPARLDLEKIGRTFGSDSLQNLVLRRRQARALYEPSGAPLGDIRRAVEILEDLSPRSSRVLGPLDPFPRRIQDSLDAAR